MTGALLAIDIVGRDGLQLRDRWQDGPRAYLGVMSAGFPNLFLVTGPGSPSVLSNMVVSIEQHVDWIAECIARLEARGVDTIEADAEAEEQWVAHVTELGNATLFPRAASWYMGANIPGKPRIFMPYVGGVATYRQKCAEVAASGYQGFRLGMKTAPVPA
jgi:cyclohexanone monooxygenase